MTWQDEQKKVATGVTGGQEPVAEVTSETGADITMSWWHEPALPVGTKLYTHPKHEWVDLTGEILLYAAQGSLSPDQYEHFEAMSECEPEVYDRLAKAIKSKLKEKNT